MANASVRVRKNEDANRAIRRFKKKVEVRKDQILSKNIRPLPNLKGKEDVTFNSFDDKELRYRHRQVDLIANPEIKDIFIQLLRFIHRRHSQAVCDKYTFC